MINTAQGIFVFGGGPGNPYGGPWAVPGGKIYYNDIVTGGQYGIMVDPGATGGPLDAENNWWGANDGPGGVGPGSGDAVSANVDYDPWLIRSEGTPQLPAAAR
ncbi:MAG TPA: hypothetical protein EYP71_03135 [Dehalococcoidia bacterium]|nr:hypothetical protein [Dehalococcoidia bacterium]